MLTITKPVYYCEHCKRHRLTASAIEKHEPRCLYNPARSACGWHRDEEPNEPAEYVAAFVSAPDIERLRRDMGGCPACMLAVVVQARRRGLHPEDAWDFDYRTEVERFRKEEQYEDARSW